MKNRTSYIVIRNLIFASSISTSYFSYSQSDVLKYAHQIVDTLASPSMHGRGYVMKGDSIAADYIKKEFIKFGVKPIGKEFYQRFESPINIFPNEMFLEIINDSGEKKLIPGKDYIVSAASSGLRGMYESISTLWFDSVSVSDKEKFKTLLSQNPSQKIIVVDTFSISKQYIKSKNWLSKAFGIIYLKNKLMFDISITKPTRFSVELLKNTIEKGDKIKGDIDQSYIAIGFQTQNVIGFIKGTQYPDSFVVITAHYDHLGMMGKDVYFPGANDNASGCAMLLNLVRYYSQHPPKYSVAFIAFGAEEVGLIGSKYYIEHQLFNINQIKFLINFDIVGTGDEGIKVVNATQHKKEFDKLVNINEEKKYLPSVQPRGKASISDHYFFEEAGVKTFYIYTLGGIKAYHDIYDRPETLPLTKFEELFNLVTDFTDYLQR